MAYYQWFSMHVLHLQQDVTRSRTPRGWPKKVGAYTTSHLRLARGIIHGCMVLALSREGIPTGFACSQGPEHGSLRFLDDPVVVKSRCAPGRSWASTTPPGPQHRMSASNIPRKYGCATLADDDSRCQLDLDKLRRGYSAPYGRRTP